eukprot:CAMPEP_0115069356 /NCGR_PEP_ID=MMETSP0227-20121206/12512_1 /TAXON_ID=89957 /ORGANISM="Polarella glacialis, Strain CCMP 1383" /LENGTH=73 /DNA_ID=CAMNT_0002455749 /DNA_START=30 /DNA_END=247 /DNA_ORIENTATION=-
MLQLGISIGLLLIHTASACDVAAKGAGEFEVRCEALELGGNGTRDFVGRLSLLPDNATHLAMDVRHNNLRDEG